MALFTRESRRRYLSMISCTILMLNFLLLAATLNSVAAPTIPGFTLKWSVNPGNAQTLLGALAADLVPSSPGLEIVVTGGSTVTDQTPSTSHGGITVLAANGSVLWRKGWQNEGYPIGIHQTFEIADLDKDGTLDIILTAWATTIALRGNDGSLLWRANAASDDLLPAVADINGDGYPEVFVSSGDSPSSGYDWITLLSHDGNILRRAFSWHPCYGGLTVGDTDFDGKFELYQGDRGNKYSASGDSYLNGGMGLRAFDALTLTPLWNDINPLCSSHAPILADVDKDGILDVIAADQNTDGIIVLNSADGTVVTTGGVYRKGGTQMSAHSEPTVFDIDNDTNLELIDCTYSQPKIWDLYAWKLDAALVDELGNPLRCAEPPKVGDVTGDGLMDIIAIGDSSTSNPYTNQYRALYVYSYDKTSNSYIIVHNQVLSSEPRAFSLVQDIDGDGLNELVLTSSSGIVYCFDTPAPAPTPRARTVNQFYSERRLGAAEYVPPPIPLKPALTDEQPINGATNQPYNPTLSVQVADFQGNSMNIAFRTNASGSWQIISPQYNNVLNRKYNVTPTNMNVPGTTYYWNVTASDGVNVASKIFRFTTLSPSPTQSDPLLVSSGGNNGSKENLICHNNTTSDANGDEVTNIYAWQKNGVSTTNLLLPFETRTDYNPLLSEELFSEGFEAGFGRWDGNGATDWDLNTSQTHSGSSFSAHAGANDNFLTSDDLDTSNIESLMFSFWYRDVGIDDDDEVFLQFWNGAAYKNIFELGNSNPEGTWQFFSVQTYDPFFLRSNFRIRFDGRSIDAGEDLWIDDLSLRSTIKTRDYSGYENHGTIRGATWTNQGVVGGAYKFDGLNDYIRVSDDPTLGGDGTWSQIAIEFWIKPMADLRGARIIAKKDPASSSASYMVGFQTSNPANTLFWGITSTYDNAWHETSNSSTTVLATGNWYHVVCTYKSGVGLKIFINGTLRASSAPFSGNIALGPGTSIHKQPLFIGYDGGGGTESSYGGDRRRWLNGVLDEVRIYPQTLSQYQISQRYTETKDGSSSNSTIAWQETDVNDVWRCSITPNDSYGDGQTKPSNTLTVVRTLTNNRPQALNVKITPSPAYNVSDLAASYDYFDADGDPECNTITKWYKNNVWQPELENWLTIPSSLTDIGEVWNFTVRPRDGADFGDLAWISVNIVNSPPFTDVYITPDPAFNTSTLTGKPYASFDFDGDPINFAYQWQKWVSNAWQNLSGQTSPTLNFANFMNGDYIRVSCTPYNGPNYGQPAFDIRLISSFGALGTPLLISELGGNTTDEDLICYNHTAAQKTNIYSWYKNDVSITKLLMPFDTNSASTAKDYSDNSNDGIINGATWINGGVVGGAYSFDGSDVITIADNPSLLVNGTWNQITVEFWVRPDAPRNGTRIINKGVAGGTGSYMVGFQTSGSPSNTLFWGVTVNGTWYDKWDDSKTVLQTGNWYHIVCTYESGPGLKIYINGTEKASSPLGGNITRGTGNEPLFLGYAGGGGSTRYLTGALDEVRIYQFALSPAQILQRYAETRDSSIKSSKIVSDETNPGETWKCQVTPNNGVTDGTAVFSNTLTIVGDQTNYTTLLVEVSPIGSGTTNPTVGSHSYIAGTNVSVQAFPNAGWNFSYWLRNNSNIGSANPYNITMDNNYNLTAVFIENPIINYTLLVEVSPIGYGTTNATGSHQSPNGTKVAVQASANAGYKFSNWLLNNSYDGTTNPYTITMDNNYNLTAVFNETVQYELLVLSPVGSGSTNVTVGSHFYDEDTVVAVLASGNSGWTFDHWLLNNSIADPSSNPYSITMNDNYNLTAVFNLEEPPQYIFEDGFETGSFSKWTGTTVTGGETASVVTTLPHDGAYHARFTTDGAASSARAYCYKNMNEVGFVTGVSELYSLAYVYIDNGLPLNSWNALWIIQFADASGSTLGSFGVKANAAGTYWALMYGSQNGFASSGPQLDKWYAVEAYFKKSSSGKTLAIYIDGAEVVSLNLDTSAANNVSQVRTGIVYNNPAYVFNLYVDTVIVNGTYISPILPPTYTISLESVENMGPTSNLGTMTVDGTPYSLPWNIFKGAGVYSLGYTAATSYKFDHWETTGSIIVTNVSAVSTTATVSGDGTIKAVYIAQGGPLFEDDFESGNFSKWTGTSVPTSGETASVIQTVPHNGSYHASFNMDSGTGSARVYCYESLPVQAELYTRGYFYFDNGASLSSWNAVWLMQFRDSSSVIASFGIKANATATSWALMYGSQTVFASSGPQLDKWYAVEAYFKKSSSGKTLAIYVDGVEVAFLSVDTSGVNNVSEVRVGITYAAAGSGASLYVDTVTIDDQYIGP